MKLIGALLPDATFVELAEWEQRFPSSHTGVEMLYTLTDLEHRLLVEADSGMHVVEFRIDRWSIEHPLACRRRSLLACPVHAAVTNDMQHLNTLPRRPGRYTVSARENGTANIGAERLDDEP